MLSPLAEAAVPGPGNLANTRLTPASAWYPHCGEAQRGVKHLYRVMECRADSEMVNLTDKIRNSLNSIRYNYHCIVIFNADMHGFIYTNYDHAVASSSCTFVVSSKSMDLP